MADQKFYISDCVEGCKKFIKDESVSLVFADPPFNINFNKSMAYKYGISNVDGIHYDDDKSEDEYAAWAATWMEQAWRILVENGIFIVMSSWNYVGVLEAVAKKIGFKTLNHVIWKYEFGVYAKRRFTTSHYHYLIMLKGDIEKGKWIFNGEGKYNEDVERDVFLFLDEFDEDELKKNIEKISAMLYYIIRGRKGEYGVPDFFDDIIRLSKRYTGILHPCKLSEDVLMRFFGLFSNEGDMIVDLFMGSGTSLVAARILKRKYIGFEMNEKYRSEILKLVKRRIDVVSKRGEMDTLL